MTQRRISAGLIKAIDEYVNNAVVCKCGAINNYRVDVKAHNHVATCNVCNSFIKNLPHDKPRFYVGEHKGKAIEDVGDLKYLRWAMTNCPWLKERQKQAISERIKQIENLMK